MKKILLSLLFCGYVFAQTTATVMPIPEPQFLDGNGNPLSGGKLFSYLGGTSTPSPTYTDSTGTVPNSNPVILDSAGRASVWILGTHTYKFVLETSANVTVWTQDNISNAAAVASVATALANTTQCPTGQATTGISTTGAAQGCFTVPQLFFGSGAPGAVSGNLAGALYSDTTNHNMYWCGAASGTAAPACTTVTAGGWTILNGGGGGSGAGFDMITSGTNTSANMLCGAGCNLAYTSTGIVNANKILGTTLTSLTGPIKMTSGVPSVLGSSDIIALWSGTCNSGTFLNGAGACAAGSGGGGGSSSLTDLSFTRTSATVLTIGSSCSSGSPCNVMVNGAIYQFTSSSTVTLGVGATVAIFDYISDGADGNSPGTLVVANSGSAGTITCSGGCTVVNNYTAPGGTFPPPTANPAFSGGAVLLQQWVSTSGSWNSSLFADYRGFLGGGARLIAGSNITLTTNVNGTQINASGSISTNFNSIASGTNTTATMTCGTGCNIFETGSGAVSANYIGGVQLSTLSGIPAFSGGVPSNAISSNVTALWSGSCNSATFLRGDGACAAAGGSSTITVGTTGISGGGSGNILFDNAGILGEKGFTGSGNVVLATSPTVSNLTVTGSCTGCSSGIVVGGTSISSGTNGQILYDNSGVVGQVVLEDFPEFNAISAAVSGGTIVTNAIASNSSGNDFLGDTVVMKFNHSGVDTLILHWPLSAFWTGSVDLNIYWTLDTNASGTVGWQAQTACVTAGSAVLPTYNSVQSSSLVSPTFNQWVTSTISGLTTTGCSPGYDIFVKIYRNSSDTNTAAAALRAAVLGIRHTQ